MQFTYYVDIESERGDQRVSEKGEETTPTFSYQPARFFSADSSSLAQKCLVTHCKHYQF